MRVCAVGVGQTPFLLLGDRLRVFSLGLPTPSSCVLTLFGCFCLICCQTVAPHFMVGTRTEALNWGQLSLLQGWWQAFDAVFGFSWECCVPCILRCHMSCLVA